MNPDASPLALKREYKRVKKLGVINGLHKSLQKGGQ